MSDMPPALTLNVATERWKIAGSFAISRGSKTEAVVLVAELSDGTHTGRGECVPYKRYGETIDSVAAQMSSLRDALASGLDRGGLQDALPSGAARNAIDCAMWDLTAKQTGKRAYELAGAPEPVAMPTAYTISIGPPAIMAEAAKKASAWPLLKIKLGMAGDAARLAAVRMAAPKARLIVDANEGWTAENLADNLSACADNGVVMVEQPLPAGHDDMLGKLKRPIPVCADESAHDCRSLPALAGRYDAVNIKLDKTGGLTEALRMVQLAKSMDFALMAGCMVSTSLAIAPMMLIAQSASVIDLDGPLLLAADRLNGLHYADYCVHPPQAALWG